jgi:KDO2-lipid IV(A) lauroyltransferase
MARGIASLAASAVCRLKPEVYWVVRANLRPVLGDDVAPELIEYQVRKLFFVSIQNYYNLFRMLNQPRETITAAADMPPATQLVVDQVLGLGRGVVLVMPHLGNFDLMAQALGRCASPIQAISLPDPPAGFQIMNEIRSRSGVDMTPLSPAALRSALRVLRAGGIVAIAGDRPVSDLDTPFPFFGHPARVPSGHIRLALKTNAVLLVGCCAFIEETQRYALHLEPPMEPVRHPDPAEELRVNMRQVLDKLEGLIRRWPEQWMVFVPIWPDLLEAGR